MSETSSRAGAETDSAAVPPNDSESHQPKVPVSMRKPSRLGALGALRGGGGGEPPAHVPPPRVIDLVTAAIITMVVASVVRGLLLLGSTPTLEKYVTDLNNKAKKPVKNFDVANAVHTVREGALFQAAVYGVALLLLAYAMRRTRSASGTRWAVLIIFVLTGMPLYVVPTSGLPGAVKAVGVIVGIAAIAALLLIFIPPQAQKYFRACREANRPAGTGDTARPGLAGLFGPKRPRGQASGGGLFGGGARRPPATTPGRTPLVDRSQRPTYVKAKAKVRSDTDAVAKGAELARSRAKASKSRRTSD